MAEANLFSLRDDFPKAALTVIAERKRQLELDRAELREMKRRATKGAKITAESVNLGKTLEHIIPSFDGFDFSRRDCRTLLQPIDYVVFAGLSRNGSVDAITFLEVKSGKGRLSRDQKSVEATVEAGRIVLDVI